MVVVAYWLRIWCICDKIDVNLHYLTDYMEFFGSGMFTFAIIKAFMRLTGAKEYA